MGDSQSGGGKAPGPTPSDAPSDDAAAGEAAAGGKGIGDTADEDLNPFNSDPYDFDPADSAETGSAEGKPLSRETYSTMLIPRLRKDIVHGSYAPGGRVSETQLAKKYGVSRTPVREALKVLTTQGLLANKPDFGAYVPEISVERTTTLFDTLAVLEGGCGRKITRLITDDALNTFARLNRAMSAFYRRGDRENYSLLNDRIHHAFVTLTGNPDLIEIHRQRMAKAQLIRVRALDAAARWGAAMAEHEAITEAMMARDAETVGRLIEEHVDATCRTVCEALQKL